MLRMFLEQLSLICTYCIHIISFLLVSFDGKGHLVLTDKRKKYVYMKRTRALSFWE